MLETRLKCALKFATIKRAFLLEKQFSTTSMQINSFWFHIKENMLKIKSEC